MSYSFKIKLTKLDSEHIEPATEPMERLFMDHTNLGFREIRYQIHQVVTHNAEIYATLKDRHDANHTYNMAQKMRSLGFKAEVTNAVLSDKLPFLINQEGIIPDSEPVSKRDITLTELEAMLNEPTVDLAVTGYGHRLKWIPAEERHSFWEENEVATKLVDSENSEKRTDYPLYYASEWQTKSGKYYIFLWTIP